MAKIACSCDRLHFSDCNNICYFTLLNNLLFRVPSVVVDEVILYSTDNVNDKKFLRKRNGLFGACPVRQVGLHGKHNVIAEINQFIISMGSNYCDLNLNLFKRRDFIQRYAVAIFINWLALHWDSTNKSFISRWCMGDLKINYEHSISLGVNGEGANLYRDVYFGELERKYAKVYDEITDKQYEALKILKPKQWYVKERLSKSQFISKCKALVKELNFDEYYYISRTFTKAINTRLNTSVRVFAPTRPDSYMGFGMKLDNIFLRMALVCLPEEIYWEKPYFGDNSDFIPPSLEHIRMNSPEERMMRYRATKFKIITRIAGSIQLYDCAPQSDLRLGYIPDRYREDPSVVYIYPEQSHLHNMERYAPRVRSPQFIHMSERQLADMAAKCIEM